MKLQRSPHNDRFVTQTGQEYFYLADTAWSVFSNARLDEWETFLDYREQQGFNVMQISVLPILHDASDSYIDLTPFHTNPDGSWDFERINDAFFERARHMVEMMDKRGMKPCLVVLWGNYAPGNWMADQTGSSHVIPFHCLEAYTKKVVDTFHEFNPIYFISGDTDFRNEEATKHYMQVMQYVKAFEPEALTAMHIAGCSSDLPDQIVNSPELDFYTYQSGHLLDMQKMTYELAEAFRAKPVKKPILNAEPLYEGHGHGNIYGRFDAFPVRLAFWSSLLAGAKVGFTYGAHGIWCWHRKGSTFNNEHWSKTPYDWDTAMRLPGAWDVGYGKHLYEQYDMFGLEPAQDKLVTSYEGIRMASKEDDSLFVVYVPYAIRLEIKLDLKGYDLVAYDLAERRIIKPVVVSNEAGHATIAMLQVNADTLIIGQRK
ncbi:apiosidase-like domain-containing protein [Paenibacillus sp. strain BS8-2]